MYPYSMMSLLRSLCTVVILVVMTTTMTMTVNGFMISDMLPKSMTGHYRPISDLKELSHVLVNHILDIRLDIFNNNNEPNSNNNNYVNGQQQGLQSFPLSSSISSPEIGMCMNGLSIELCDVSSSTTSTIKLPGINGPHPVVSSGIHSLSILQTGQYIDMNGVVTLPIDNSVNPIWELIYRDNAMAGYLICGMNITKSVTRFNNMYCAIPAGIIYISFPIWKNNILIDYQQRKKDVLERAEELLDIRNNELNKMSLTNNIFQKAIHYRNAAAAVERYTLYPVQQYTTRIPDMIDIIPLYNNDSNKDGGDNNDLVIAKYGTVWTTSSSSSTITTTPQSILEAAFMIPNTNKQNMLGTAILKQVRHRSKLIPELSTITTNEIVVESL